MYCAVSIQWSHAQKEKRTAAKCNNGTDLKSVMLSGNKATHCTTSFTWPLEETILQAPPRAACSVKTDTMKGPQETSRVVEMVCNLTWAMVTRMQTLVKTHPAAHPSYSFHPVGWNLLVSWTSACFFFKVEVLHISTWGPCHERSLSSSCMASCHRCSWSCACIQWPARSSCI